MAAWPVVLRLVATVLTTMLSQAGLWAEAYLVTGMIMDAIHGQAPTRASVFEHPVTGMKKAMVYGGVFMGSLYALGLLWEVPLIRWAADNHVLAGRAMLAGAIAFPLLKTIIETFDGSPPFFRRLRRSYRKPVLFARGAVVGLGVGCGLMSGCPGRTSGASLVRLRLRCPGLRRDRPPPGRPGAGPRPRAGPAVALLPGPRAPRRIHRRRHRVLPRCLRRSPWWSPSSTATSPRASRRQPSTSIPWSASGDSSIWGRSPAA